MKQYKYKINGNLYNVTVNDIEENIARVEVNGTPYTVEIDKPVKAAPKPVTRPASAPKTSTGAPVVARPAATSSKSGIKSPLPGVILDIKVKEGDTVKKGQLVAILEAMKMENNIASEYNGTVKRIFVKEGSFVKAESVIMEIEE